jgi:long-chain-fatty-acyl-CoA reductase
VVGDTDEFVDALGTWLTKASSAIPRRVAGIDGDTHVARTRMEAAGEGWRVVSPDTTDWTVVVTDGPTPMPDHPLSRLLYVHPVSGAGEVVATVDHNVQTVGVEPWDRVMDVAGDLTAAGAVRIVPAGHMGIMRPGFVHDGFHPMRRMVRWVTVERGYEQRYRFMTGSALDDDARIRRLLGG